MSNIANLFKQDNLNLYEDDLFMTKENRSNSINDIMENSIKHTCDENCTKLCNQSIAKSISRMFNTLPNNRDKQPIFIENLSSSRVQNQLNNRQQPIQSSKFSNFSNYKAMLDKKHRQRSKFFDIYYPNGDKLKDNEKNSTCDSLSSSQSSAELNDEFIFIKSESIKSINDNRFMNEIQNFNLNINPVQFNMDKVTYVKTISKTKTIIEQIMRNSKVIGLNCDSDCCLQDGIDLLEVAITFDQSLDHPDIYIFDIYSEPKIMDHFKPVFANPDIVKVMFDARFDLRILSRRYGITEFTALFDIQLAYRVLMAKLQNCSFEEIKREKLLYVSWQCNGPVINFEKLYLPQLYYFKRKQFWKTRPINFEMMYNAAYDVFVMVPQLFTNLVIIMERNLNESSKKQFINQSNELISRNLVPRKFAFFQTKHQYLNEMHKQIDLLIQSDKLHRHKLIAKWQLEEKLIDETNSSLDDDGDEKIYGIEESDDLFNQSKNKSLQNQINELDTDSSTIDSPTISNSNSINSLNELYESTNSESGTLANAKTDDTKIDTKIINKSPTNCTKCNLLIKNNELTELIDTLESEDKNSIKKLLFKPDLKYCQCDESIFKDDEAKCMNLLVDQIIDLAECKEDYMELDE